jgi:hypothetical protein
MVTSVKVILQDGNPRKTNSEVFLIDHSPENASKGMVWQFAIMTKPSVSFPWLVWEQQIPQMLEYARADGKYRTCKKLATDRMDVILQLDDNDACIISRTIARLRYQRSRERQQCRWRSASRVPNRCAIPSG